MDKREHATPSDLQYIYIYNSTLLGFFITYPLLSRWSSQTSRAFGGTCDRCMEGITIMCLRKRPVVPWFLAASSSSLSNHKICLNQKKSDLGSSYPLWSTIHHPGISYDDTCCHKNMIGTQIQKERVGYSKTLPVKKYQLQVGEDPMIHKSIYKVSSGGRVLCCINH